MSLSDFKSAYLAIEENGSAVVARFIRAQLSDEENIEQMGQELMSLVEQYQCRQLVLSLELVDFITSAALGKIIMLHRRLHRKDGKLVVCSAHGPVADVLQSSRLNDYFVMAADTQGALALLTAS
ncbi:MAG: STAS domain-containing protein [Planctomycetaceae bacterium]|nr:STAS domain-containing protein [Planctomycetaceae bacterium]